MTKVFNSNPVYISFLTTLPLSTEEKMCLSFFPSAFFPKDQIAYYFESKDPVEDVEKSVESLWQYGRSIMHAFKKGHLELCLEMTALRRLCSAGIVHGATPRYEISFAVRVHVLEQLLKVINYVYLVDEPLPYIFRLTSPDSVLMDVKDNINVQLIQGIYLKDTEAYKCFLSEFNRLKETSHYRMSKPNIINELNSAIISLRDGYNYIWPK